MDEFLPTFNMVQPIAKKHIVKKLILVSLASLLILTICKAQTSVTKPNADLTIIVKNSPRQKFVLQNSSRLVIDSAMLGTKAGADTLHFDLYVAGRELILRPIFSNHFFIRVVPILAPGEHLKINADISNPENIRFSGSEHTREFYDFSIQRMSIGKDFAKYKIALNSGSPDSALLKRKIDSINNVTALFIKKTIFNTTCGYVAVFALMDSQNGVLTYTKKELNELKEKFKDDSLTLKQLDMNEDLQAHPQDAKHKPSIGTYLAAFTLPDINGRQVSLNEFKGKYVLLDFWASWCGPCRKQSPYVKKMSMLYSKNKFVILSVSIDKNHNDWKKAIIQDGTMAVVNLIDDRGWKSSVTNQYNITSIPSNFLIDPAGKVVDKDLTGEKLLSRVAEVIKMAN